MEDDNSMSDRILRTLETIFNNDTELKEFSIIPTTGNTKNKSPVVYEDHNVGLESWCVKHIYRYAYMDLFDKRQLLRKGKLSYSKMNNLNHLLIGALLINPDVSTFWNMKRELIERDIVSIDNDLSFTKIVLTYKGKSNETFAYRRWLLQRLLGKIPQNDHQSPQRLLENELQICESSADRNPNNYHSWTHRIWTMENLTPKLPSLQLLVQSELDFSASWIQTHVSEHTGYHYRQYLIDLSQRDGVTDILEFYCNEVVKHLGLVVDGDVRNIVVFLLGRRTKFNKSNIMNKFVNLFSLLLFDLFVTVPMLDRVFPGHEALWCHRRFVLHRLMRASYDYHELAMKTPLKLTMLPVLNGCCSVGLSDGEKQPKLFKSQPNKVELSFFHQTLIKTEMDFLKNNSHEGLVKKHERWLRNILCLEQF